MTNQEWLNQFMILKQQTIRERLPVMDYYDEKDAEWIIGLQDGLALKIKEYLEYTIEVKSADGLRYDTCPFCFVFMGRCLDCSYGKNHGDCIIRNSDWRMVIQWSFISSTFTNQFYKELIKKLNKEDS